MSDSLLALKEQQERALDNLNRASDRFLKAKNEYFSTELAFEKAKKELNALNLKIERIENTSEIQYFGQHSDQKVFYVSKIKEILKGHDTGLKTKNLYEVLINYVEETPKYETFRSYLSRMKDNEICQDENKNWHLKE